jgi:preprotein translocase subunit SecG
MKKNSDSGNSQVKWRSISVAALLIVVVLLSAGSGIYAGASYFAQQANVTITTTIYTTTTSWTTSTIWSTTTSTVYGVWTTVQYTTSTSTVTITGSTSSTSTSTSTQQVGGTSHSYAGLTGAVWLVSFTASASGTVTAVGLNLVSGAGSCEAALYDGSNNLLGSSSSVACASSGWQDLPLGTPVQITAGTVYKMAFQVSSKNANIYYSASSGANQAQVPYAYGAFPNPVQPYSNGYTWNMRITYVPS